jgi:hypothetical protein
VQSAAVPAPASQPAAAEAFKSKDESVTNTQTAGVDEGGIVKAHGDLLIVLRRGRLFTLSTADGGLRAVDSIDAFPPGVDASDDWYDEMLVAGERVVVIGYSYERGGTEINRFRLSPDGGLSFEDAYHLRSDDYYSAENYASRLIGDDLILYSPLSLNRYLADPLEMLPGLDRWRAGRAAPRFTRITPARRVFVPQSLRTREAARTIDTLHAVTRCDLTAPVLDCEATVVLGHSGRSFYVSSNAVYVWANRHWSSDESAPAYLYRLPLNDDRPGALAVRGAPRDQFSFREDGRAGRLDMLVYSEGTGDAMWSSRFAYGVPALLSLPYDRFGDGSGSARIEDYRLLPSLGPLARIDHNRFVGSAVLYAQTDYRDGGEAYQLVAAPLSGAEPVAFPMPDRIDRIEVLGRDALVVGGAKAAFQTIDLSSGPVPTLGDRYVQPSRQAESRSQAFFYRADADSPDGADGLLGLPVSRDPGPRAQRRSMTDMLFVRRQDRRLSGFGRLASLDKVDRDDGCQASCVDWYGGARPIFLGDRVFALLGYELVEGDASGGEIRETRRIDFAPTPAVARE